MRKDIFAAKIIDWYAAHQRPLPWRETTDPYKIWLSEVILQQTRVAQGMPYYHRMIEAFPSVVDLARAPEKKVLRLWQGLGYYSRARNLHSCAQVVTSQYGGIFPSTFDALKTLPGVGPYTAAAIASIAFRQPVAVVDGNVFRVLARVFGIDLDIASPAGKKYFSDLANTLVDTRRPDLFNQAVMEFGALHCLPQNPACDTCIFYKSCQARQKSLQTDLPVKSKKAKVRTRYFYYFVIRRNGKVLLRRRTEKDIWQGLYDFYLVETKRSQRPQTLMKADSFLANATVVGESETFTHLLTHQKLAVKFVELRLPDHLAPDNGLAFFSAGQIARLPKPILIDRYLRAEV